MGQLLDAIYGVPPAPGRGGVCKIGMYLKTLDPEVADDLQAGLDSDLSRSVLSTLFAQFQIHVGPTLVSDHRAKRCTCYRKAASNDD